MNVDSNIDKLLLLLSNAKNTSPKGCSEMYCSTCGGFGGYIERNLKDEDKALISYILENGSFDQLERLQKWLQLISRIAVRALATAYCRLAADVDVDRTNIEAIDKLIFRSRKYVREEVRHSDKDYQTLIQQAIALSTATQNSSLLETLILTLGQSTLNHPDFLQVCIESSKQNKQLRRTMYNLLRVQVPELRDFPGSQR